MIKDDLYKIITDLNKLDSTSDTLIKINWKTFDIIVTQRPNSIIMMNSLSILFKKIKGWNKYFILSDLKLRKLKQALLTAYNNFDEYQIHAWNRGFSILTYTSFMVAENERKTWFLYDRYKLLNNSLFTYLVWLVSADFRQLYKYAKSVK